LIFQLLLLLPVVLVFQLFKSFELLQPFKLFQLSDVNCIMKKETTLIGINKFSIQFLNKDIFELLFHFKNIV
jgi:hypothetical protein